MDTIEQLIEQRAPHDSGFAIAWALLKIASALEHTPKRKQRDAKPPPRPDTPLIG